MPRARKKPEPGPSTISPLFFVLLLVVAVGRFLKPQIQAWYATMSPDRASQIGIWAVIGILALGAAALIHTLILRRRPDV